MSRKPGIGANYLDVYSKWHKRHLKNYLVKPGGYKRRLPRYYKDRLFNVHEKEILKVKSQLYMDSQQDKELKRLEKFHSDPYYYLMQITTQKHDRIEKYATKLEKL